MGDTVPTSDEDSIRQSIDSIVDHSIETQPTVGKVPTIPEDYAINTPEDRRSIPAVGLPKDTRFVLRNTEYETIDDAVKDTFDNNITITPNQVDYLNRLINGWGKNPEELKQKIGKYKKVGNFIKSTFAQEEEVESVSLEGVLDLAKDLEVDEKWANKIINNYREEGIRKILVSTFGSKNSISSQERVYIQNIAEEWKFPSEKVDALLRGYEHIAEIVEDTYNGKKEITEEKISDLENTAKALGVDQERLDKLMYVCNKEPILFYAESEKNVDQPWYTDLVLPNENDVYEMLMEHQPRVLVIPRYDMKGVENGISRHKEENGKYELQIVLAQPNNLDPDNLEYIAECFST